MAKPEFARLLGRPPEFGGGWKSQLKENQQTYRKIPPGRAESPLTSVVSCKICEFHSQRLLCLGVNIL